MLHGKEIYLFFGIYGVNGVIGIIIAQVLVGLIIYKTITITEKYNIKNYSQLIEKINTNNKINEIIKINKKSESHKTQFNPETCKCIGRHYRGNSRQNH